MTKEEVIELARFASNTRFCYFPQTNEELEYFAELVIRAERKRLARECAMLPFGDTAASFSVWIANGGKP